MLSGARTNTTSDNTNFEFTFTFGDFDTTASDDTPTTGATNTGTVQKLGARTEHAHVKENILLSLKTSKINIFSFEGDDIRLATIYIDDDDHGINFTKDDNL